MELDDFEGRWRVARQIKDRAAGRNGRFEGVVSFVPDGRVLDGQGLLCREAGELIFDGLKPMAATRSYLWRAGETGIDVLFEDERPFHSIVEGQGPTAWHWCDPDAYEVVYDFSHWPDWRATWIVRGPRKDYTMVSDHVRIAP
ncbi:DUF6314 family protein [Maritimibacter sp. DP1N21-5]|uniref:DUF6314 family protein n=1 Tax=Maritimibacter sp. DP1N21-5 TaxID=2836867 RepID=UPI001C453AFE|nr:DUF6314 family protein [Maritimibacter sp. DP1N21-5]MBV7410141.1 hypothetical protein [Maritimibacter sp. DP1N21-5]